jgi:ubiquinone biosynthesis protein COQ9
MSNIEPNEIRDRLIEAILPNVAFDGWTQAALRHAAEEAGIDSAEALLAFPNGPVDALFYAIDRADRLMVEKLSSAGLEEMRIRDRIATAVRTRIEAEPDREAVRRGLAILALPQHAPRAAKATWRTVDLMWRAAGDRSHDYNYYTKRGLLAGVWTSTLLFWLNDRSEGSEATWAFLDRRIEDVMKVPKLTAPLKKAASRLPDPFRIMKRMQSGSPFPRRRYSGPSD